MTEHLVIVSDNDAPDTEGVISMLDIEADWSRQRGTLFQLNLHACFFRTFEEDQRAAMKCLTDRIIIGNLSLLPTLGQVNLRQHGGCYPDFINAWRLLDATDPDRKILPPTLFGKLGGSREGDYYVSLESKSVGDSAMAAIPFVFSADDRDKYPQVAAALENVTTIADSNCSLAATADRLKSFPEGIPYRAEMIARRVSRLIL